MVEPINDPLYWKQRLTDAKERHHSIFKCDLERWKRIEEKHKKILAETIDNLTSVLDAGCGYGRLLTLLPEHWYGDYVGVDLSPDFIELAKQEHPTVPFFVSDLRSLFFFNEATHRKFDWAVLISIRPMVRRNLGDAEWEKMEKELKRVAKNLLFLEYDENDLGEVVAS